MIKYCVTGVLAILLPLSAQAGDSDFEKKLMQCSLIQSSVQRLDCYDELAQQLEAGEQGVAARAEQGRSDFGMEHRRKDSLDDKVYVEVVEKWQSPHGAWRFITADGQEWHQTQVQRSFNFSDDKNYFIERGALGSFSLGYDGSNRTTRVRRVK